MAGEDSSNGAAVDFVNLDMPPGAETFDGQIKVASRIIDFLSSGLYESPGACLKELVNNSYDADATTVKVLVKPDADRIIIVDDGVGISKDEFTRHFNRVSESHKRDRRSVTASGRPMVGRIGIGLIAANELCDAMEIISTKRGSTEKLHVEINFAAMRDDPRGESRRDSADTDSFKKGDYRGWLEEAPKSHHFTQIFLKEVRGHAREMFSGVPRDARTAGEESLYGLAPDSVAERLGSENLRSWAEFDEYSQTMLDVGLNVPVRYAPNWIPSRVHSKVADLEKEVADAKFTVLYDGSDLRKPTVLHGPEGYFLRRFNFEGEHVSARGYFFARRLAVRPQELNGLLIRIRRAAVAAYDGSWMGFSPTEGPLFQDWISAEIYADDRLEDALNIDRRTLRVTHPAYVELQGAVHRELTSVLSEARKTLYKAPSEARRADQARTQVKRFESVAAERDIPLPAPTRKAARDLDKPDVDRASVRRAVAKFQVADIFDLALDVAQKELPPNLYRKFAKALAERLLR